MLVRSRSADAERGRSVRLGRLTCGFFLLLFAFYALSGPGHSTSLDGSLMMLSARNLIRSGTTSVPAVRELTMKGPDGLEYAKFGPGMVLAHLPVLWITAHLEQLRPLVNGHPVKSIDRDAFYAPFTNAALVAATVCGIALCGMALGFPLRVCFMIAALMAVGSPLWVYARIDSTEALQGACLLGATYLLLRDRQHLPAANILAAGALLAVAVATKALNLIVVPWFVLFVAWRAPGERLRAAICLAGPLAIGAVMLAVFNVARFGAVLETGYELTPRLFGHPFLDGAATQLFSMGHGLLLFCPAFVLLPLAARECARRFPAETVLVAGVFTTYLVVSSKWWAYWGMNWGPRFLIPMVPLLALGLLPLAVRGRATKIALGAAFSLGMVVQGIAVTTSYWDQVMPVWMRLAPPRLTDRGDDPRMEDIGLWNHLVHRSEIVPLRVGLWLLQNTSCKDARRPEPELSTPPWSAEFPWIDPQSDPRLLGELLGLGLWAVPECWRLNYAPLWSPQKRVPIPSNPRLAWALLGIAVLGVGFLVTSRTSRSLQPDRDSLREARRDGEASALRIPEIIRQLRRGIPAQRYTREYFLSDQCDGFHEFQEHRGLSYVKQRFVERLGAVAGERVLEIGCGRGEVLLACSEREARTFGIDYARDAIGLTHETCNGRAILAQADATALPFRRQSFHKVFLGDVLEHLTKRQADAMLSEVYRVLEPRGQLLLHTSPNVYFMHFVLPALIPVLALLGRGSVARTLLRQYRASWEYHAREYSEGRLRRLFRVSPFDHVTVQADRDVLRGGRSAYTASLHSSALVRVAAALVSRPPLLWIFGNDLWVVADKKG